MHANVHAACEKLTGVRPDTIQELPVRRHTFSHFHLDIHPQQMQINYPAQGMMDSNRLVWYKAGQIKTLGLAAPVARLLQEIEETK
jgi:A/G-specific adenine glycosylase